MRPFRFRAATVLELRQKEEDAAGAVFARAQADLHASEARLTRAERRRREVAVALAVAGRSGIGGHVVEWHRNWMAAMTVAIGRFAEDAARLKAAASEAERAWQRARQRRLMLERMRERLWRRHRAADARHELNEMNELARLRYVDQRGSEALDAERLSTD